MSTILCPFCFNKSKKADLQFRCGNVKCSGMTPDLQYAAYQGSSPKDKKGQVFTPSSGLINKLLGKTLKKANCPTCQRETFKRVCPTCHYELGYDAGETNEKMIAVIGGRSSGKSIYITTLIHRLENEVGRNFQAGVMFIGDSTRERYTKTMKEPLFDKKDILKPTQTAASNVETKTPMVIRVTFNVKNKLNAVNLVLFDTAGEDMKSLDTMSSEARYICCSDAIIFLLDPLQIKSVRQQLSESVLPKELPDVEPSYLVQRLCELHQQQLNLKPTAKINKPIAFTLAKADALFPLIDAGSILHRSGDHLGYLNLSDVQSVHTEISAYLETWLELSFTNNVKTQFQNYRFFGISALGQAPINDRVERINSLRVEDPLLWIFNQFGFIKGKK